MGDQAYLFDYRGNFKAFLTVYIGFSVSMIYNK